jgi:hypothetical protein
LNEKLSVEKPGALKSGSQSPEARPEDGDRRDACPTRIAMDRRLDHDAVRAQLDLPDFFENLAGNHGEIAGCRLPIAEFKPVETPACANKSTE